MNISLKREMPMLNSLSVYSLFELLILFFIVIQLYGNNVMPTPLFQVIFKKEISYNAPFDKCV